MPVLDRWRRATARTAGVWRRPRFVALTLSSALVLGMAVTQPAEAAADLKPAEPAAKPQPKVASRPDVISAAVTARAQGSRVEVESMRTETSSTWSNPDGTMTTEAHAAPIRFKTAKGWEDIDLTLQKAVDGSVAPRSQQHNLRLGKRSAAVFASADSGPGRSVEWLAPWKLPDPVLDGTKATYAEVQPGVDLVVDARRDGFEHDFIVKQRPATAPVWRIPLRTKGLTPRHKADGSIEFVDAKNVVRSTIPVGFMWDSGPEGQKPAVKVTVEQVSPGKATLVIAPDAEWILDPARVFPVTVDPTYWTNATYANFDTFVQSDVSGDQSNNAELRVGKTPSGVARSFLNFDTAPFKGKDIVSSWLNIWQHTSASCTPSVVNVRSTLTLANTSTRWANQPALGTVYGSLSAAKGFSAACPNGRILIPMTSLARAWSNASYTVGGLALVAANEADPNSWKEFYSTTGLKDPVIGITWNRAPAAPARPNPSEATLFHPLGSIFLPTPYSATVHPWVKTKATDPDGNTVKYIYEFHDSATVGPNTLKGTCTSSVYASGTEAGCRPAMDLPENTKLYIRAKTNDGRIDSAWSEWAGVSIGTQPATTPTINCPAPYANNSWQDTSPDIFVTCTVSATGTGFSAPGYLRLTVDGKPYDDGGGGEGTGIPGRVQIQQSTDPEVARTFINVPADVAGLHTISAVAETPAGKLSSAATYSFGTGGTGMTSPVAEPRTTTTSTIRVTASGPPRGQAAVPTAHVRWRLSGYGSADETVGWNEDTALTVTDKGAGGVTVSSLWDTNNAKIDAYVDSDPDPDVFKATELNPRVPVLLDVQVCFKYGTTDQCTWSQTPTTVQRLPHAFGNGFPTAPAGPGQVALWTGEFNLEASDVSVPGYTGDLSISRSHSTYSTPTTVIDGAFGQGWIAQFDGAEAGAAGLQVVDSTKVDGTIALIDGDGTSLVYGSPTGKRRTTNVFDAGTWVPADEDTDLAGSKLTVSGTGASTVLAYTEEDGTVTTWNPSAAPTTGTTLFRPVAIAEPGVAAKTTYAYDANGRVVRILAPTAPGVSCAAFNPAQPLSGMTPGCRALRFVYTTIGASRVRLSEAWLDIYNPDKSGGAAMESIKVASYEYDVNALLIKATDPRSNLATEYTYNSSNHLTSVKPAGQPAYQLNYGTPGLWEKLDSVKRDRPAGDPAGGTATLAKFVYDVPLSGAGLPDLTAGTVSRWNQRSAPTNGFAVFGPDRPLSGAPGADDWQYADLQYTDASGYTVNSAKYGAGDWQYTSKDYNALGNVIRELDERAVRAVLDSSIPAGGSVDQMSTATAYNADVKNAAGEIITPAGTLVTDTWGPARSASVNGSSPRWVRAHTHTEYDEAAPNAGINTATTLPYRLVTTVTTSALDPLVGTDEPITRTLTDYDPVVSGDPSGWALGQPSKTITDANPAGPRAETTGDVVKVTRHDSEGRVVESRQPNSNGADAGTTKTVYYTAAANSAPECGLKPQWAGLICKTFPAAAPSSGPSLPTTTTTGYNYLLSPKTVVETSGAVTRTTTTSYLPDGRTQTSKTAAAGLTGSTPNTEKTTTYDAATGLPTVVTAKAADNTTMAVTTGYDTWGRQTSYQPQGDSATTTAYDASGQVATVTDSNGSTRYTYDGTDAAGKTERRGLATKVDVTTAGSTWSSAGAYDADGSMTTQKLPGGIKQYTDYDNAGEPTGLRYTGQVTSTNEDGTTTTDPDGPWLSWSVDNDVTGRVVHEWTPAGNAFTGAAGDPPGDALGYDRGYTYDGLGRLTKVQDRTAATTGVDVTDPAQAPGCITRSYGFDRNDNRLTKSTAAPAADGSCTTSGATTTSRAFDTADRPSTGYTYDALGRTTTLPAADAPKPADGNITLAYYDNDLARSIAQAGTTTTYTLDALDRRSVESVTSTSGTTQTIRHYTDTSDNPTWVTQGTTTQRYAELIGDNLSLTVDQTGKASLPLANPHGDIATTVDLTGTQPATSIGEWCNYDEYGQSSARPDTGSVDYGWLGEKQRAASTSGLVLMGVRLYNPATGLFTSLDPVPGGNPNAYTYPTDPMNLFDLDGRFNWWKWKNKAQSAAISVGAMTIARATGNHCRRVYGTMTCYGGLRLYARGGTTYGSVYFASGRPRSLTYNRIRHERFHVKQWKRYGYRFGRMYLRAPRNPCRNQWERAANLGWGDYPC